MRVGLVTDSNGVDLKDELMEQMECDGHVVIDFSASRMNPHEDYFDCLIALARAVAASQVNRGVVVCQNAGGAAVCANKVSGVRAESAHDHFSVWQGVEDDHMNILCIASHCAGPSVAWDLVQTFLAAEFGKTESKLRLQAKVESLEGSKAGTK